MLTLNWQELEVEGLPAVRRALQAVMVAVNRMESQQAVWQNQAELRLAAIEERTTATEIMSTAGRRSEPATPCVGRSCSTSRNGTSLADGTTAMAVTDERKRAPVMTERALRLISLAIVHGIDSFEVEAACERHGLDYDSSPIEEIRRAALEDYGVPVLVPPRVMGLRQADE